jgi:hypothetical protein
LLPIEVSTESFGAAGRFPCGKGTKRADRRGYAARSVARACALNAPAHCGLVIEGFQPAFARY